MWARSIHTGVHKIHEVLPCLDGCLCGVVHDEAYHTKGAVGENFGAVIGWNYPRCEASYAVRYCFCDLLFEVRGFNDL